MGWDLGRCVTKRCPGVVSQAGPAGSPKCARPASVRRLAGDDRRGRERRPRQSRSHRLRPFSTACHHVGDLTSTRRRSYQLSSPFLCEQRAEQSAIANHFGSSRRRPRVRSSWACRTTAASQQLCWTGPDQHRRSAVWHWRSRVRLAHQSAAITTPDPAFGGAGALWRLHWIVLSTARTVSAIRLPAPVAWSISSRSSPTCNMKLVKLSS
jgi:hypothetical protein